MDIDVAPTSDHAGRTRVGAVDGPAPYPKGMWTALPNWGKWALDWEGGAG